MNDTNPTAFDVSASHAKWMDLGSETAERKLLADPTDLDSWVRTDTVVDLEDCQ